MFEMRSHGYPDINEQILDRKFRNLKKTYTGINTNGRQKRSTNWEHLKIFDEIALRNPNVQWSKYAPQRSMSNPTPPPPSSDPSSGAQPPKKVFKSSIQECIPVQAECPVRPESPERFDAPVTKRDKLHLAAKFKLRFARVEEQRLAAIEKLTKCIELSNQIQSERNELLKKFLNSKNIH